jgi:hypothetical protein
MHLKILVQGNFFLGALFSQLHKRLVYRDANQPGRELGIFSEVGQILEGFQQGFLDRVLGIFPVARDGLRDSEKSAAVSLYELLEGGNISFLADVDKLQIVACHFPHCELC